MTNPIVLHIITGLSVGGAERTLYNVVSDNSREKQEHVVLSLAAKGYYFNLIHNLGVPVYTLDLRSSVPNLNAIVRLGSLVRRLRPRIIQGWMYHGNLAAWAARNFVPAQAILAWNVRQTLQDLGYEKPVTRQVIRANRTLSRGPSAIIYNSRMAQQQHESFGFERTRSRVIPNGFDTARLRPQAATAIRIRAELGVPKSDIVVGHVARYHPMKDHVSFLRAAVSLARTRNDVRFLLAGRNVRSDSKGLAGLIPTELSSRFVFLGERRDVVDLMQAMDMLVLSSAWGEAFPNVLGEAMALGVPCVATDVGDVAEIVGDTGQVVPPRESETLANSIRTMLDVPRETRMTMGERARTRIKERYALSDIVKQYNKLYDEML